MASTLVGRSGLKQSNYKSVPKKSSVGSLGAFLRCFSLQSPSCRPNPEKGCSEPWALLLSPSSLGSRYPKIATSHVRPPLSLSASLCAYAPPYWLSAPCHAPCLPLLPRSSSPGLSILPSLFSWHHFLPKVPSHIPLPCAGPSVLSCSPPRT